MSTADNVAPVIGGGDRSSKHLVVSEDLHRLVQANNSFRVDPVLFPLVVAGRVALVNWDVNVPVGNAVEHGPPLLTDKFTFFILLDLEERKLICLFLLLDLLT